MMPTNRSRTKRARNKFADVRSWVNWELSILKFCNFTESPWKGRDFIGFWKKNRDAIMVEFSAEIRKRGKPFQRPAKYFAELEAKQPRLKTGVEKWFSPVMPDGKQHEIVGDIFETDAKYLERLGLLEPWESGGG